MNLGILDEIKKLLTTDEFNSLDKNKLNNAISAVDGSPIIKNDAQGALFALHYMAKLGQDFFCYPEEAQAGDVSVTIDWQWLQSLPLHLQPIVQSLATTPWGQKLLFLLMQPDYSNVANLAHVGAVDCDDKWRCTCCQCNPCCC